MPSATPKASLPPPITSDVPGTWAYDTMSRRVRKDILARIFRENTLQPSAIKKLENLDRELANAAESQITFVEDDGGPDVRIWNEQILPPHINKQQTWLSAPWAVAEFYL